jgi:hypothetical protein
MKKNLKHFSTLFIISVFFYCNAVAQEVNDDLYDNPEMNNPSVRDTNKEEKNLNTVNASENTGQSNALDIIIKNTGDTIVCKITGIDSANFFFVTKRDGIWISTYLQKEYVADYKYNVLPFIVETKSISTNHKTSIGFGIGIAKEVGEDGKSVNPGFSLNGEIFQRISDNLLVGGRIAYNYCPSNKDTYGEIAKDNAISISDMDLDRDEIKVVSVSGHRSIFEIVPCLRFAALHGSLFAQVGIGYYIYQSKGDAKVSWDYYEQLSDGPAHYYGELTSSWDSPENKPGISIGAGLILNSSGNTRFLIYPLYTEVIKEKINTHYFTISLDILFGL